MRHTVEIADTDGITMRLSVYVNEVGLGGSWYSLTKGMIKHHNGPIEQTNTGWSPNQSVEIDASGTLGIHLDTFISWDTVNSQGNGWVAQPWCIGLTPGAIEWAVL